MAALHEAALLGRAERLAALLRGGNADLEAKNTHAQTPLHCAAERGHVDCVRLLLAARAAVDAVSEHGGTPLLAAVYWGHEGCVRLLLEAKANFDFVSENGKTMADIAMSADNRGIERLLESAARAKAAGMEGVLKYCDSNSAEGTGSASDMPSHILSWMEEEMRKLRNEKHFSLMHWLFMQPTCDEKEIEGFMAMYMGERKGQAEFAYEFARRKEEWRVHGQRSIDEAKLRTECEAGLHDAGDETTGAPCMSYVDRLRV